MATLDGKYGPRGAAGPAPERAAAQLESYRRACRASLASQEGPLRPPVLQLSDDQLAALFAPRQLDALVRPLVGLPGCPAPGGPEELEGPTEGKGLEGPEAEGPTRD